MNDIFQLLTCFHCGSLYMNFQIWNLKRSEKPWYCIYTTFYSLINPQIDQIKSCPSFFINLSLTVSSNDLLWCNHIHNLSVFVPVPASEETGVICFPSVPLLSSRLRSHVTLIRSITPPFFSVSRMHWGVKLFRDGGIYFSLLNWTIG